MKERERDERVYVYYIYFILAEDCGSLDNPQNGKVDATGTAFWDTAMYTCNPGFDLIGKSKRTCQENGQWSGVAPFCRCKYYYSTIMIVSLFEIIFLQLLLVSC